MGLDSHGIYTLTPTHTQTGTRKYAVRQVGGFIGTDSIKTFSDKRLLLRIKTMEFKISFIS